MSGEKLFESEAAVAQFSVELKTRSIGKRLHYFSTTSSTNDLALQAARGGAPDGTVFVADAQESGRGRRGRAWQSSRGLGLLFSAIVDVSHWPGAHAGWIPLAAGLACAEALTETTALSASIKWPNDVILPESLPVKSGSPGWRKLGGILCESHLAARAGERSVVVVGIGLNINHSASELPELAKAPPVSVLTETGAPANRVRVFAAVLEELERRVQSLQKDARDVRETAAAMLDKWWTRRTLEVQAGGVGEDSEEIVSGRYAGLNENGWLRLKTRDGAERTFADAEVLSAR